VEHAQPYRGVYRDRQIDAAIRLFAAQGVERHDKAARMRSFLRNYAFFGAPHAAFLFIPPDGGLREAADCGKFAQTFMLALAAAGVGSCPQGSLSDYPQIVRATLGLEEEGKLLMGISFGYADPADPTSEVRPARRPIEDLVQFH
jgi:nitroreductase